MGTFIVWLAIAIFFGIILVLWLIVVVFLLWMAATTTFGFFDSVSCPTIQGVGQVIGKYFAPKHKEEYTEIIGEDTMINTRTVPDYWTVRVRLLGRDGTIEVDQDTYNRLQVDDQIIVDYRLGRFSGQPHMRGVRPLLSAAA